MGLPNEQIGYAATEEYTSRLNTPHSATFHHKGLSGHSQTHISSPLRKASFPVDVKGKEDFHDSKEKHGLSRSSTEHAVGSETEDEAVHVDAPVIRKSKITGNGYDPPTEDLGPRGGNTEAQGGYIDETGYGVPILASDEVAKEPAKEYLQPAVSPAQERRGSNYYSGVDSDAPPSYQSGLRHGSRPTSASNSRPTSRPSSRPGSRPGSIHGSLPGLNRFVSHDEREDGHTPLEDVEEYEPLFPEDDGKARPNPALERVKRKEMMRRFPSQDIWEDTPNSLQLQATVSTPEAPEEAKAPSPEKASAVFETPEAEGARKGEASEKEKAKLISNEERLAKSNFKPHIRDEMHRPGMVQRFPSRDIWEDSPDSARLETTVDGPQDPEVKSPVDEGFAAGAVVNSSGRPDEGQPMGAQTRDGATAGSAAVGKPTVPPRPRNKGEAGDTISQPPVQIAARPPKRIHQVPAAEIAPPPTKSAEASPTESKKAPTLPDRPKPQVPARPTKPMARDSSESVPLSKTTSATSVGSSSPLERARDPTSPPPAPKPKPALPARPVGSKIAALKAGFMSDLNKQLQGGPPAPKKEEKAVEQEENESEDKAPLIDARKGRARGPARRKPATASTSVEEEKAETKADVSKWAIHAPQTIWESEHGTVMVISSKVRSPSRDLAPQQKEEVLSVERPEAPTPNKAATAHSDIPSDVPAIEALQDASPDTKAPSIDNEPPEGSDPSGVTEAEVSDLLHHDSEAPKTTSNDLETLTSKTPAAAAPPKMTNESSQTGTTDIVENPGQETEEKLTAYLGGEAQKGETVVLKE